MEEKKIQEKRARWDVMQSKRTHEEMGAYKLQVEEAWLAQDWFAEENQFIMWNGSNGKSILRGEGMATYIIGPQTQERTPATCDMYTSV